MSLPRSEWQIECRVTGYQCGIAGYQVLGSDISNPPPPGRPLVPPECVLGSPCVCKEISSHIILWETKRTPRVLFSSGSQALKPHLQKNVSYFNPSAEKLPSISVLSSPLGDSKVNRFEKLAINLASNFKHFNINIHVCCLKRDSNYIGSKQLIWQKKICVWLIFCCCKTRIKQPCCTLRLQITLNVGQWVLSTKDDHNLEHTLKHWSTGCSNSPSSL